MAVLGKRKAPSEPATPGIDANDLLRRHFEARFQPLSDEPSVPTHKAEDSEDQDSEWDGLSDADNQGSVSEDDDDISDDDDSPNIEVVDHSKPQLPRETVMTKRESKAFMSFRPPDQTMATITTAEPSKSSAAPSVPEDAPSLLKQDLELRRLLAESHLLAPHAAAKSLSSVSSNVAHPKSFALGRTRQKATDLRVQALGSKLSIHKQEKMPMHMRKGMTAAAEAREAKRRREAKENGIILERETGKKKRRKERGGHGGGGVDRPGVGRLKGAELRISERDVRGIEGSRDAFGRRGRR